jgi:hypothetical protein
MKRQVLNSQMQRGTERQTHQAQAKPALPRYSGIKLYPMNI